MKLLENSTVILIAWFCLLIPSESKAKIAWDKDLVFDANMNSTPLACCSNKDGDGVIVMAVECPRGAFPVRGGDSVLWKIGADGKTTRISLRNIDGGKVWTNAKSIGPGCAIASDNSGNLLTIGVLSGPKEEGNLRTVSLIDKMQDIILPHNQIESHSIRKLIWLQDNTFVLIGDRNGDGLCLRIDAAGRPIQQELFDMGAGEMLTGLDPLKPDNLNLAVVGLSARIYPKEPNENSAENFILIYDPNLKIVHKDYFAEEIPGLLLPKVCCLDNGNIILLYRKASADSKTRLSARCYTQELELLWEKEIFSAEDSTHKLPFYFDVTSCGSKGFAVGVLTPLEGLKFYFFDKDGGKVDYTEYRGMVSIPGFNLMRIRGGTIAVFEEYSGHGKFEEITIKAKVIAVD
ncbi:MAG TPA: hypothetical protein VMX13_09135 [Sedimentisphaerales bacterium]|nr:hypothetical protein [Sedimentisphaerales bacterium]